MTRRPTLLLSTILLLACTAAFAHAGHAHTYMGSVTMLHGGGEFMMKTTDGKELTVRTNAQTRFTRADDQPASAAELAVGMRVVVKMTTDGRTAASVKLPAGR